MRLGIAGCVLGMLLILFAFFILQRLLLSSVAGAFSYRFSSCVFDGTQFPGGDLENGRMIRRALLPIKITTKFYDAQYREVTQADKPGRYGAIVRIDAAGTVVHRFITLYRTPVKIFWDQSPLPIFADLPAAAGLDPAVLRSQQREIGAGLKESVVAGDRSDLAILLAGLSETPAHAAPAVDRTNFQARNENWWYELRRRVGLGEKYRYLVDLPEGYENDPAERWPLILFLASADDQGSDLGLVRKSGLAGLIDRGKRLPALVVSPQCPSGEGWSTPVLTQLLDEVCAKYRVEARRIYLTGISAGGDGAWALALAHPERFAAIVPICGDTDPLDAARLANMPIWAFHGMKDDVVPVCETTDMIAAIRQAGGHPHMTLFPDEGHRCWNKAYSLDALYIWLLAQKLDQAEIPTAGVPSSQPSKG